MKTAFAAFVSLALLAGYGNAQSDQQPMEGDAQPTSPAPALTPPAPPEQPPPLPAQLEGQAPDSVVAQTPEQQPPSTGQWVYTAQYGWVWIPYGAQYTYEPSIEGYYPSSFLYYPAYGWAWVASPWVWGWGPWPYFGYRGVLHYHWYRTPGWHRAGWAQGGYRRGWGPYGHGAYQGGFGGHRSGNSGSRAAVGGGGYHGARHR